MPEDPYTWDFFDHDFADKYLCQRVKTSLYRKSLFDSILLDEPYWETFEYPYECYLMYVYAWGQFRVHFWLPYGEEDYRATFYNSQAVHGKQTATDEELSQVTFEKGNQRTMFITNFTEDLQGIRSYSYGLHTLQAADLDAYNGWNFTNDFIWDDIETGFWFSPNTTILY